MKLAFKDGSKSSEKQITLTREPSVVTELGLFRDGTALDGNDALVIPVEDRTDKYTYTAKAFDQYGVEMPITAALYAIIKQNRPPREAMYELMSRDIKNELE